MSGKTGIQWTEATWRDVPEHVGYQVSATGEIRNMRTGIILKPHAADSGHLYITHPRGKKLWLHRAVLTAFVGPCSIGQECRHLNGDPTDNRLVNLAWGTRLENAADTRRHGKLRRARYAQSPLTAEQVAAIKVMIPAETRRVIASRFGVSHATINKIAQGRRWVEVSHE